MMTQTLDGSVFSFCEFAIPVFLFNQKDFYLQIQWLPGQPATVEKTPIGNGRPFCRDRLKTDETCPKGFRQFQFSRLLELCYNNSMKGGFTNG